MNKKSEYSTLDAIKELRQIELESRSSDVPAKFRFLGNYTQANIAPFLRLAGYRHNLKVDCRFSDFDTFQQEIVDTQSPTYQDGNDFIVLSLCIDPLILDDLSFANQVDALVARVRDLLSTLQSRTSCYIGFTSFFPSNASLGWHFEQNHPQSRGHLIREVNHQVSMMLNSMARVVYIDLQPIVDRLGIAQSLNSRFWYMFSQPFSDGFLHELSKNLVHVFKLTKTASKKVLVLDCDNTLWKGVVGEDGIDGISIHSRDYPGNAFQDFQRQVLSLKDRGVLLALSSKNNLGDVQEVFDTHPHMLLKQSDFAAIKVDWNDKASHLRSIATELNLGLDSMVFVDDSPTECELVRAQLPSVTVLQVPKEAYLIPTLLRDYEGFDRVAVTDEDLRRTQLYQDQRLREHETHQFGSLDDFLASLELRVMVQRARDQDIARVAQLSQKTNQFNLTTKRYSEAEIGAFLRDPRYALFVLQVQDRFGDYGQTGVAILKLQATNIVIDTFLMSCRILGKNIEQAFLSAVLSEALRHFAASGVVRQCLASYVASAKNKQVADFYDRSGFVRADTQGASAESVGSKVDYFLSREASKLSVPEHVNCIIGTNNAEIA